MRPTMWIPFQYYRGRVVVFLYFESYSHTVDGVDDLSYFDYVFGVVNGVYDLKYYCMVIWDDQGGIVKYFKKLHYPHITTRGARPYWRLLPHRRHHLWLRWRSRSHYGTPATPTWRPLAGDFELQRQRSIGRQRRKPPGPKPGGLEVDHGIFLSHALDTIPSLKLQLPYRNMPTL